jgi:parallel beta-helix repeat protein
MYLKNCHHALVRNVTVTGGMNGLMLTGCNDGLFYNNNIHFNSGVGIGLYRSSRNRVMHNRLDWNVRGYSHGFYQRGQDSAAILVYEQSNENTFAYNSATHSGDGFFLWAGQTTMDTGEGGCNDNLLYRNDFSHAPTNGVEVTFSRNKIEGCWYGIAIEHGQQNVIVGNEFRNDTIGVQLWSRESQPADWGYAQKRDVASRDYQIGKNLFNNVKNPLKIHSTKKVAINDDNQFSSFEKLLVAEKPNEAFYFVKNDVAGDKGWKDAEPFKNMNRILPKLRDFQIPMGDIERYKVEKLADGMDVFLSKDQLQGRQYILVDEWGPYDFQSPAVWLRNIEGDKYTFLLTGPNMGNWQALSGEGWSGLNPKTGSFPATIVATKKPEAEKLTLNFEFISEAFTDRFGNFNKKGKPYSFSFRRYEKKLNWKVSYFNYDEDSDPMLHYDRFDELLKKTTPAFSETKDKLSFAWWDSPGRNVHADKFGTRAAAEFSVPSGVYRIRLTSDDGVKLFLDGIQQFSNWDIHEPETDEFQLNLSDNLHKIEIVHFDGGGFATLDFRMEPL